VTTRILTEWINRVQDLVDIKTMELDKGRYVTSWLGVIVLDALLDGERLEELARLVVHR
jgi:hypothetical protein